jgi:hypothetical protein
MCIAAVACPPKSRRNCSVSGEKQETSANDCGMSLGDFRCEHASRIQNLSLRYSKYLCYSVKFSRMSPDDSLNSKNTCDSCQLENKDLNKTVYESRLVKSEEGCEEARDKTPRWPPSNTCIGMKTF